MALSSNTAKRRSAAMWIEVTQPEAKKASPDHHSKKEDLPILSLTHFAKTPWVCFGEVKLNCTKLEALIIHNPTASPQTVTVEKLSADKGFHLEKTSVIVEPGNHDILEIAWTPQKAGNYRELVNFRVNATYLKQVILLGTALAPKISKERKKKPLKVLHPSNQTYVKASSSTGSLFTKKAESSVGDIVSGMTVASVAKIPYDFRIKCSSTAHDCSPLNLSISSIYHETSYERNAVFDSPQTGDFHTPEILRAYRNRPKKSAAARRKSQYNVRLTPEAQAANSSDKVASPSTVQSATNELSPTRIPIAMGRGSPTKVNTQSSPSPVSLNTSKGYQNVAETSFSQLRSTPDRRQTYVAAARCKIGSSKSDKSHVGEAVNVPSSRSPNPKPSSSPVDRRQTFVARSPRGLKQSPNKFYPVIDKNDANLFSDIPDTPERRNTFVKVCSSQSVVPNVTLSVGTSWADQCEVLESELVKDLTTGCVTCPLLTNYDVPRLEGMSRDDRVAGHSPKKSRVPVVIGGAKSKTDPTLNLHGTSRLTAKSKKKAFALPSSSRRGSIEHIEQHSVSDCAFANSVSKSKAGERFLIDKSKPHNSSASGPRRGTSTYRQTRYSDIIEVDDGSGGSGTGLSDSLETVSPAMLVKEKSTGSSPALNDSLEILSPHVLAHQQVAAVNLVEDLPSTSTFTAPFDMLSPTFQNEAYTYGCPADRVLYIAPQDAQAASSVESVCLSDELIEEQYALATAVPLPTSPTPALIVAGEGGPNSQDGPRLGASLLNYAQFCQELPLAAASGKDGAKVCDDEIRRCSTEVKPQGPKESVAHEACRKLFPDEGDGKMYFDPEQYGNDAENGDMRRISSGTFIKTPCTSPMKASMPLDEEGVKNLEIKTDGSDVPCDESKLAPGKRKSDEFSEELQQVSKRLKGPLVQNGTCDQEKSSNKAKSSSVQPQNLRSNKSLTRVMPSRLKLIKPPTTGNALAHHPNPFAAKNAYYDERWAEKQTHGFTRWLNFMLAMPDEFVTGEKAILEHMRSMDVREVTCPSREVLSLREYRAGCSLNRLRRKACNMYQSKEIIMVVNRVEAEIEKGQLSVRKDKALHADIGIRQSLIEMIMGYNSLWLRLGLETVFGVLIPIRDNNEAEGLSNFILNYLLNNAELAKEYAHPVVPYLYKPGFAQMLKKHTLKKFLLLVFFLDRAKVARLLQYNPCLFNKDAPFKCSKDLLLTFSKDYLHGEGNIIKHLAFIGYKVSVQQNYLDEYDFSVKNLAVDLRNGIRLVKVTELVTHNWRLLSQVRIPSESRLQKLHNVGLVFSAFKSHTGCPLKDVSQKDIVDGHKEKTLCLLWQMLYKLQISELLSENLLRKEIYCLERMRHMRGSSQGESVDMELFLSSIKELYPEENLQLLLRWCNLVCARYGMQVENFTVAFSDGRALCFLINHYFPVLLPYESIKLETTQTYQAKSESSHTASYSSDDSFNLNWTAPAIAPDTYESLLQNERNNISLVLQKVIELGGIPLLLKVNAVCNTIPDEKVMIGFISYLWNRLWNLAAEVRAARTIQLIWRRRSLTRKKVKQLEVENKSALILQRAFKRYCKKRRHLSAMVIQNAWRTYQGRIKRHKAASKVQTWYRGFVRKRQAQELERKITYLQSAIRGYSVRSNIQTVKLAKQVRSATLIQAAIRGFLARKRYRILTTVIPLQAACKGHMLRLWLNEELLSRKKMVCSTIVIQSAYRRFAAKKRYQEMLKVIYGLQTICKGFLVRRQIKLQLRQQRLDMFKRSRAARIIQHHFRHYRRMCEEHISATKIQAVYRSFIQRKAYMAIHAAALTIQKWYRECREVHRLQVKYLEQKKAAICIQACVRRWLDRKQYCAVKTAAVKIQAYYRGLRQRKDYALLRSSAAKIQRWFRSCYLRWKFCQTRIAVVKIQRWYHLCKQASMDRKLFVARKAAILKLQTWTRAFMVFRRYKRMKVASICIQSYYRGYSQKKQFKSMVRAAVIIQSSFRGHRRRKKYLELVSAAKVIQQRYKSRQSMRLERTAFLDVRNFTIILQSQVRMWLIRKNYCKKKVAVLALQAAVRGYLQRKRYQSVKSKVMKIQQWYRNRKEIRLQRLLFLQSCAIRIQSFYRMHLMCHKYKEMRAAVVKIQTAFRARRQKLDYQQVRQKIVKIQAVYRGHIQWMSYNKKRQAALVIQHWYLLMLKGKRERELFLLQRKAVITIQAHVRRWLSVQKYLRVKIATVKVQSAIRGFLCRKRYQTISSATLKIQTCFRAHQQRRSFLRIRHSAVVIQQWYKCSKETSKRRCLFLRKKEAAIVIQTWFRMSTAMLYYHRLRTSVLKLQSYIRGYQQRMRYTTFRLNTIKVQRWYKNLQVGKQIRKTFLKKKYAALVIQTWFRMSTALLYYHRLRTSVLKLQSYIRCYQQRKRYTTFRLNTIKVQRWYKNLQVGKQIRKIFLKKKYAALVIQEWFRNWIETRRQHRFFLQQKCAACAIQQWYRYCIITSIQRRAFMVQKRAVIIIQHWYRNCNIGRNQRKSYLNQRGAAVCIQRWYRNCILSRNQRKSFLQQKLAANAVQSWYRTCCLGRSQRKSFLIQREAVICIQRWHRSCILNKYQRKSFLRQKDAAIAIQQWYRNCNLSSSQRKLFLTQRNAAIFIQRWRRNCVLGRNQRKSFYQKKDAAAVIQKWYRNCCLGRSQRKSFLIQRDAVIYIQQWHRNLVVCQNQKKKFMKQKAAAVVIQRCYRNFTIKKIQRKLLLVQHSSASNIQQWYRNCLASRSQRRLFLQQRDACVYVQKWYRGCVLTRSQRKSFLLQRNAAATLQQWFRNGRKSQQQRKWFLHYRASCVVIQCWYKNCILQRVQQKLFLQQKSSACTIQQWYRNCSSSRHQRQIFLAQKESCLIIQCWYRNSIVTRNQRQSFVNLRNATCVIQLWYRNCIVSRQLRRTFVEWRYAASAIQYWFRNCIVSRNQHRSFLQLRQAAIVIQHWFRNCWLARIQHQTFLKQKESTIAIQKWYRSCVIANQQRQNFLLTRNATVIIQRWYHSCTLAKHEQGLYLLRRKSAVTIQQWYRNGIAAKYQRQSFLQNRHSAVIIQRWYRNCMETKHQRHSFLSYRDAALAVQRWYRSCTLARHEQQLFFQYKKAAVTIQQWYRRFMLTRQQRQQFLETRNAVIIVQTCVRRWLVLQRLQLVNKAAVIIQSSFRSYRQRKFYTALKRCVVKLQSIVRTRVQRKLAAILIQRWYHHCKYEKMVREELHSQMLAAVTIQTWVRRWMTKKKIKSMTDAAIVVQRYFRFYVQRKHVLIRHNAAVTIQTAFRCWQRKNKVLCMTTAAVIIQSNYRAYSLRSKFLKLQRSAIKIQTQYRTYRLHRAFKEKRLAAVMIQSWFRLKRCEELLYLDYRWEEWNQMQTAARLIQVAYRKYRDRKRLEQCCRNHAVTIIQAAYRGYSKRVVYHNQKCSAVKIQRWFRLCLKRELAKKNAAVKIQSFVRMWLALKWYKLKRNSAVIIQNAYRSHLQRQLFKKLKIAAVICQSKYRGRVQRLTYVQTVNAVRRIKKWYRVCIIQRAERQRKLAENIAATKVQSFMRMWFCKKQYTQFKNSALVIQKAFRLHTQRHLYAKQKHAVVTIQRWYRQLALKKHKKMYRSICLIQAAVRAYLRRKKFLRQKCAAVIIQQWFCLNCEGRKNKAEFQRIRNAAIKIQCLYRSNVERRRFLAIRNSAIILQSFFRMWSCQQNYHMVRSSVIVVQRWYRHVKKVHLLKWEAALRIQAWLRMCIVRKYYLAMRQVNAVEMQPLGDHQEVCKPRLASSEVQHYAQVYKIGEWEKDQTSAIRGDSEIHIGCDYQKCCIQFEKYQAAIRIQRWYRNIKYGYQVRRWFLITRGAILTIQAFYRGMKCRQNIFYYQYANHVRFTHKRWQAAIVIQQWWRRIFLGFVSRHDYLVMRGAAIMMQTWIRSTLTRRNYLIMRGACICLQANWRRYIARREYGIYRGAVLFIQYEFRRKLLRRTDLVHYHIMRGAAITIQAFARGYLVRQQISQKKRTLIHEQFNDDFKALCSVPCNYFADLPVDQQASFHIMRGAAITIQAWVRGWLSRRLIKKALMATQRSLYYQLSYGQLNRRLSSAGEHQLSAPYLLSCNNEIEHDKNLEYQKQDAVVKIQSVFRMRRIRKKYIKMQVAVRIIQVWYRQITLKRKLTLALQEYRRLVAVRIIQQCWRNYQDRKLLLQCCQNTAAVKIQNCWRERQKRVFDQLLLEKKQRTAAVKIQKWWLRVVRSRCSRQLLDKKLKATSIIQRAARKFIDRRMFLKRQMAAIKIQSWVRMLLARRAHVLAKEVAVQKAQRLAYLKTFACTVRYNLSVIRIQRAYRFYAMKRDRRAAVQIQAVWRGYKVRSGIRDRRVSSARQRILSATQSATPDNTLWSRTITALDYLLHCRNLSTVLIAINDLEVAVRLSAVCCKQLVDVGGVPVLYKLISGCNRSIPHMEIISGTISILLSLAKYEETKSAVWLDGKVMDVIPEIIRNFREKNTRILTKCCSLFWLLAQNQQYRLVLRANCKFVELLKSIHYLVCRKAQMEEQRQWHMASLKGQILPVCKGTPSTFHHKALRMPPDWILGERHMREFEEPVSALSALLKSLNITPKKLQF